MAGLSFFTVAPSASDAVLIQRPLYVGLTQGLVGSWSFDGNTMGTTSAYDASGNNTMPKQWPIRVVVV